MMPRIKRKEDGTVDSIHLDDIETLNAIYAYLNKMGVKESLGEWSLGVETTVPVPTESKIESVFIKKAD